MYPLSSVNIAVGNRPEELPLLGLMFRSNASLNPLCALVSLGCIYLTDPSPGSPLISQCIHPRRWGWRWPIAGKYEFLDPIPRIP